MQKDYDRLAKVLATAAKKNGRDDIPYEQIEGLAQDICIIRSTLNDVFGTELTLRSAGTVKPKTVAVSNVKITIRKCGGDIKLGEGSCEK